MGIRYRDKLERSCYSTPQADKIDRGSQKRLPAKYEWVKIKTHGSPPVGEISIAEHTRKATQNDWGRGPGKYEKEEGPMAPI